MTFFASLFLTIFLLQSCGSSGNGGSPDRDLRKDLTYRGDFSDFGKLVAEEAALECENASCPASVVSIYTEESKRAVAGGYLYKMNLCSGTAIAPDLILTNFHCVEEQFGQTIGDCKGKLYIRTLSGDTVGCKEIIYDTSLSFLSENSGTLRRDIAIIRVDRELDEITQSDKLKVSPQAILDDSTYYSYVVNFPETMSLPAKVEKKSCRVMDDNSVYPLNGKENQSFEFLGDCEFIKGNSGSALLSEKNEIVGVIFAKIQFDEFKSYWGEMMSYLNHSLNLNTFSDLHAGLAVSLTCLKTPKIEEFNWNTEDAYCPANVDKNAKFDFDMQTAEGLDKMAMDFALAEIESVHKKYFDFEILREDDKVFLQPKCFKSSLFKKEFPDSEDLAELEGLALKKAIFATFELDRKSYGFKLVTDSTSTELDTAKTYIDSKALGWSTAEVQGEEVKVYDCE